MSRVVPEVGLITSWHVPVKHGRLGRKLLPGLSLALEEGINVLDLYFLDHADIPWYAKVAQIKDPSGEPHTFAAALTQEHLQAIAKVLRQGMTLVDGARTLGWRPRIGALATFFPNASLPEQSEELLRNEAARALQNTLYLASLLGCRFVEIVGGAAVPGPKCSQRILPKEYRKQRLEALAKTLCEVYDPDAPGGNLLSTIKDPKAWPLMAIELEPGDSFLMNDLKAFKNLCGKVAELCRRKPGLRAGEKLRLNVDVAHAFLIGYSPLDLKGMEDKVAHMHLSDHAGDALTGRVHTSDLIPGFFHGFKEFKPWLELAIRRTVHKKDFSGIISVELEAINDIDQVLCAINVTRRWIRRVAERMVEP
jgi:hypothetical protein